MNNDLKLITERLDAGFKRLPQTRYQVQITDDPYDKTYNFFLNYQHRGRRLKSQPLHAVSQYRLTYLEQLIKGLREHTQLSFEFVGFTGQRWPSNQRLIQGRRYKDE
ncbi:acetyl-CoA carboxylase [Secundilactobacillus pentosiphilus]|uniref:Acetyl-CoA carboxylase n=1 Tax=Secundilactobacillus pentosiphilus TaxID=1714682 RepID=A0A1Z5IPL4_9LACO|nr:acetyl-CoA carboxylase [Secundilactobacillus pentosiphilus]GAX03690.1 acetyl-CoA carboxylase [Secundilactobacillus pentosiphilus]